MTALIHSVPICWTRRFGGIEWRHDRTGIHTRAHGAEEGPLRTPGAPVTCRAILRLFGKTIRRASEESALPPELLIMIIATETAAFRRCGFTGPRTFRWEPRVRVIDSPPAFNGDYSVGPMQLLASTARDLILAERLPYAPYELFPVYRTRPAAAPETHHGYDPDLNIRLGAALISHRLRTTGTDPILVAAVHNAGGLKRSNANRWHLRTHGDYLDRAARWYGDACAVVSEGSK